MGVVLLFLGALFLVWIASWGNTTKLIVAILMMVLLVAAYRKVFPDKEVSRAKAVSSSELKNSPQETRAHFAARYKKAYPATASTADEELVKQLLHDYPEWCSKVEGGCP